MRKQVLAVTIGVLLTLSLLTALPISFGALPFFDDFRTGDVTPIWDSVTNSTEFIGVRSGIGYNDTYAMVINYTGTAGGVAYAEKSETYGVLTDFQFELYFERWDVGSSSAISWLAGIGYYGNWRACLGFLGTHNARFLYRNGSDQAVDTSFTFTLHHWYLVELQTFRDATTGNATMWIDGDVIFSQTNFNSTGDGVPTVVKCGVSYDYNGVEMYYDNVHVKEGYIGVPAHGPTAVFTVDHNPTLKDHNATFDASTSLPGWTGTADSPITDWDWDFNDTYTDTGETVEHNFTALGTYNISLTVTDGQALTDTIYYSLTISEFEYLTSPHSTGFLDSEQRGALMKWIWDYPHNDTLICKTLNDSGYNAVYMEISAFTWFGYTIGDFQSMIEACRAYNQSFHVLLKMMSYDPTYTNETEAGYGTGLTGWLSDWEGKFLNGTSTFTCLNRDSTRDRVKAVIEYLVTNYTDICDINLDYIRYDNTYYCYCDKCKADFLAWQIANGKTFTGNWNDYGYGNASWVEYSEWRRTPINNLVRDIRTWAFAIRTNLTITADVYPIGSTSDEDTNLDGVGQDVTYWITHGYIDAVVPMNYYDTNATVADHIATEQALWLGGGYGAVPLINFLCQGAPGIYGNISYAVWINIINHMRDVGSNGYTLWRYGGLGFNETGTVPGDCQLYGDEIRVNSTWGAPFSFKQSFPVLTGTTVTWTTDIATTGKVEYSLYPIFLGTNNTGPLGQTYIDIAYAAGTLMTNTTVDTFHNFTIPISPPFYYRVISNDTYLTLASPVYSSSNGIVVTVTSPTNSMYSSSTIPVSFTASGSIDQYWYNAKNGSNWVYVSNQTGSSGTFTGFVNGIYTGYFWANNTDGDIGEEIVIFAVSISVTIPQTPNTWWSFYW